MAIGTGAAIIGSALIGAGGSALAARSQSRAARAGIDEQGRQYDITREDFAPWRRQGRLGLLTLADYLGFGPGRAFGTTDPRYGSLLRPFTGEDLASEPGYQFGLAEGEKGIDRAMRARGSFDSGSALKSLTRFGQDYAGTKFNEGFNRDLASKQNLFNMLAGISGTGQTATAQVASAGQNSANNIAALLGQQGNARAAGIVGGVNAWNNAVGNYLQHQQNQNMWNYLNGGGGARATGPFGY